MTDLPMFVTSVGRSTPLKYKDAKDTYQIIVTNPVNTHQILKFNTKATYHTCDVTVTTLEIMPIGNDNNTSIIQQPPYNIRQIDQKSK